MTIAASEHIQQLSINNFFASYLKFQAKMATFLEEPPGSDIPGGGGKSYAALLCSNLPSVMKTNVLEIILEKDVRGPYSVSVDDIVKMMSKVGIDPKPGVHLECVQICPNGRGVIFVTLKKDVPIERFCSHDVVQVTESDIRAVQFKPAGKRDVVVTLKGVHPNTRDDGVMNYLSKFEKITSSKVVRPVYGDGPLKGVCNGDRMYKLELSPNSYLGTYHVIDGQRVTAKYPGQLPTCARCFGTFYTCPGKGLAKRCEQEGGSKKDFNDYILHLWDTIGYNPAQVELEPELSNEHSNQELLQFTPEKKVPKEPLQYAGVRIKSFPRDTDHGQIVEFLINSGLPESLKQLISIKNNGSVLIETLPSSLCLQLIEAIHGKTSFGKRLFCNWFVPRTPEKADIPSCSQEVPKENVSNSSPSLPKGLDMPIIVPNPVSPMTPNTFCQQYSETPDMNHLQLSNVELVRRNSLSLRQRTPPHGSLAKELLNTPDACQNLTKVKDMLTDIKDMAEKFPDFASCESLSEDSDTNNFVGFQTPGRRKKGKKTQT